MIPSKIITYIFKTAVLKLTCIIKDFLSRFIPPISSNTSTLSTRVRPGSTIQRQKNTPEEVMKTAKLTLIYLFTYYYYDFISIIVTTLYSLKLYCIYVYSVCI